MACHMDSASSLPVVEIPARIQMGTGWENTNPRAVWGILNLFPYFPETLAVNYYGFRYLGRRERHDRAFPAQREKWA
jgi:hypothetical protein